MQTPPILIALVIIISPIVANCATTDPSNHTDALNNTSWVLSTLIGQPLLPGKQVTMHFEKGRIKGSDGCNSYSNTYAVTEDKFKAGKTRVSTKMACPALIMRQANVFLSALTMSKGYKIDPRKLILLDTNENELAVFTAQSTTLVGTSWRVTGYNNGKQAVVSVITGSELTADFNADGKLAGLAGCNIFAATYKASEKNIKIAQAETTKKMCALPAGVMEQETQYLKALATAANYRLDGDRLELRTTGGALAVSLSAVDNP